MSGYIAPLVIGIICIVIGISNTKGNISTLHSYHRNRVSDEDRLPFGKIVGLGTIICGIGVFAYGAISLIANHSQSQLLFIVANVVLGIGLIVGLGITFYGMIKYNKGIF